MNENDEEYDMTNDYEFMAFMDDEDADFYLPLDEHNPNVIIKLETGAFYLWTQEGLFHLLPQKVVIEDE